MNDKAVTKLKKQLIKSILDKMDSEQITHVELAKASGVNRTALTQILSGSRTNVTLDKILQLAHGAKVDVSVKIK